MQLPTIKRGLVLFWAAWYTVVFATNFFDALKAIGAVGAGWAFASGNFAMIRAATAKFALPAVANGALFVGVMAWQATAAALLWIAGIRRAPTRELDLARATTALGTSLGLWAAFVLADELFVAFEGGTEAMHLRIFTAQLVTLVAVHLLP